MVRFYSAFALAVMIGTAVGALGHIGFAAVLGTASAAPVPAAMRTLDARQRMAKLVAETAARAAAQAAKSVVEEPQLASLESAASGDGSSSAGTK
jgi:hypothetical protein